MRALWKFLKIGLVVFGALFVVFIVLGLAGVWDQLAQNAATANPAPTPTPTLAVAVVPQAAVLPPDEAAFIAAVAAARDQYRQAANDMAKGGVRARRKGAICRALRQAAANNWLGKIYALSSNSDGNGVVEITIAPDIYVKTWNNALSDTGDHTLIPAGSPLFQELSSMATGDAVRFSGRFVPSAVDCVREASLTQDGSMTEPEFLMRFSSAVPAP